MTDALAFFALHGAAATEPLSIEVARRLPEEAGPTAAGCYLESRRTVYVVPFATFRSHKTWFGVPIDRALYRSLASHEAAHAVAACRFRIPNPTIQAKEYLAYVAMFSTMPPALRTQALKIGRTDTFDSFDRFTPMLYLFDHITQHNAHKVYLVIAQGLPRLQEGGSRLTLVTSPDADMDIHIESRAILRR